MAKHDDDLDWKLAEARLYARVAKIDPNFAGQLADSADALADAVDARPKAARMKSISGVSGQFVLYVNRALRGREPKRGQVRKLASTFLKNYPAKKRSPATLERAWRRSQSGAKAARTRRVDE
jgi:hypothetical protein